MSVVASLGREAGALWRGGKGPSLVVIATGWGLLIGTRMIYPVLIPHLRDAFDLSLAVAGLLVTILWLGGAFGQLPGGIFADRYSERTVMAASVFAVALALVLVVSSRTAVVLFAATGLVGVGQSLYPIARITVLSDIYPDRIGSALGVTMATGDLGQTILPPVGGAIAVAVAWRAGLGFTIPLFLAIGVCLLVFLPRDAGTENAAGAFSTESVRAVLGELRQPNLGFMVLILFLYLFIWQSFTGFYPTYLIEEKGLSTATAGALFSLFFALGVVVKPLAGAAYDRIGMRGSLVGVLVPPIAGFALLPVVDGFWPLVAITAFVSTMLGSGAITQSFLADSFAEDVRGTGLGVVRTATATFGALGPVLFGVVAELGFFDQGYVALAGIMAVVVLLTLRTPQP